MYWLFSIRTISLLLAVFASYSDASHFHSNATYTLCSSVGSNFTAISKPFNEREFTSECHKHFLETILGRPHSQETIVASNKHEPPTFLRRYGYGFIAVLIISALSLVGLLALPMLYKVSFKYMLSFFTAIAIGTLFGDAMFHLIPLALGLHSHGGDDHHGCHDHDHPSLIIPDYQWKILLAVSILYLFYLLEVSLHWFAHYKHDLSGRHSHGHSHSHKNHDTYQYSRVHLDADIEHSHLHHSHTHHNLHQHLHTPSIYSNAKSHMNNTSLPCTPCVHLSDIHVNANPFMEDQVKRLAPDDRGEQISTTPKMYTSQCSGEFDSINPILRQLTGIKSTGWMVLFGDGIHNFADGLAIGAAFSQSVMSGVAITITVACHEIPHELGDYAVLLQSGFSHCRALLWNFLSGTTAIIGFFMAAAMADSENARKWIFAATIGMFLYIALVDLLPTLLVDGEVDLRRFLVVNVGFLFGITTMFLLALFEEKIQLFIRCSFKDVHVHSSTH